MNQEKINVLDYGYVQLVESWGNDERIIEAARMSTGKGFQGWGPVCSSCGIHKVELSSDVKLSIARRQCDQHDWRPGDEKLLRYLWTHKHHTPFEMSGATFEIQAPIFVFREWHRHRTQSYNEMSARYIPLPDVSYVPSTLRCIPTSQINKQAGSEGSNTPAVDQVESWLSHLQRTYLHVQDCYDHGLRIGVPKEIARVCLPVARYSRMRASANLRNWLGFLTLRMDNAAQWEIRQYAEVVGKIIGELFPRTWELFVESKQG